jgi:hypothetical protein
LTIAFAMVCFKGLLDRTRHGGIAMATRSERFKAQMQRLAHGTKTPAPEARPRTKITHNEAARAAKNSTYELEGSGSARPSRKSTRRSPTHVKTDSALRITTVNRNTSPQARSQRRGGKTT